MAADSNPMSPQLVRRTLRNRSIHIERSKSSSESAYAVPPTPAESEGLDSELTFTVTTAADKTFIREPLFHYHYLSDEEALSPIDADDMSVLSSVFSFTAAASEEEAVSDKTFPEYLASSCGLVEQQCSIAQAVYLVSAGRARVVQ
ncbi:hypothetical protein LTR28_002548, partial [Elasticomyces elasticus]